MRWTKPQHGQNLYVYIIYMLYVFRMPLAMEIKPFQHDPKNALPGPLKEPCHAPSFAVSPAHVAKPVA